MLKTGFHLGEFVGKGCAFIGHLHSHALYCRFLNDGHPNFCTCATYVPAKLEYRLTTVFRALLNGIRFAQLERNVARLPKTMPFGSCPTAPKCNRPGPAKSTSITPAHSQALWLES